MEVMEKTTATHGHGVRAESEKRLKKRFGDTAARAGERGGDLG
jgi:hypothetical protein